MSLILDALNRSRQERDAVPGLATDHLPNRDREPAPAWRKWLPWIALGAALVIIVGLLLERGAESPSSPAAAQSRDSGNRKAEQAVKQTDIALPSNRASAQGSTGPEDATSVTGAGRTETMTRPAPTRAATESAASATVSSVAEPARSGGASTPDAEVAALYARKDQVPQQAAPAAPANARETAQSPTQEPVSAASQQAPDAAASVNQVAPEEAVEEEAVDIEKMVALARDGLENARLAEHPAPFIADLSQRTKDDIPTIFYQRHDYRGDASASSVVVLNGKELRVGGRPATGVKVEEILPDSVVLSYQGTEFRLRALNSWVNL